MTASDSPGQESACVIGRFAPSPTGRLHIGHALSAIRAHDLTRAAGGHFLLRIEDIDGTRSRAEHVETILADLAWLGLAWDGPVVFQSERLALYAAALATLKARGLVYPCFCTRAEIAASASAPHGDAGPVYPGTCRAIDPSARMDDAHCWRLDMAKAVAEAGPLTWWDECTGEVAANPLAQGDVVLARKDVPSSYHLAVTVDDAAQGVTDVVRGQDLFDATHIHRLLQALLGLPTPRYHHHPLLLGADGQRLAKRHGAPTLAAMREAGADGRPLADEIRAGRLPNGVASA
ncbi:tRNA glutamyl-Q(34) synthetase GluQRS [Sphingomonas sp. EC-HK361]|uniref:tRNA glutamyl-Q(34) synthetase GluQRS n=1 Tax=Sphingomonas sp. EC-HK361 TaxID=2038397 RepID=UPI00125FB144|nr:tRNA glutamyl-Q(34) synthetase GluQRS [Sphingomonas sp. EC-HK361]